MPPEDDFYLCESVVYGDGIAVEREGEEDSTGQRAGGGGGGGRHAR